MFTLAASQNPAEPALPKPALYQQLAQQAQALFAAERDPIANTANLASLIWHTLPGLNWAGFYLFNGTELVLGPFMGKPACVRIPLSRGVCGAAGRERRTQLVADVHAFPGHIACDEASRSECVVPLVIGDRLVGVLDLDSPTVNRFSAEDQVGLEAIASILLASTTF